MLISRRPSMFYRLGSVEIAALASSAEFIRVEVCIQHLPGVPHHAMKSSDHRLGAVIQEGIDMPYGRYT